MPAAPSSLDRFLRALHRRQVAQRLQERTGLGLLGGSAAALLLTPLSLAKGLSDLSVAAGVLATGAAAGLVWGLLRRPTLLGAAVEADRQLGTKDLLATAASCRPAAGGAPDPWCGAVLAVAEWRCRELKPRSVLVRQLGARAWGGIGLSTAAALAVALLVGPAADSQAAAPGTEASAVSSPAGSPPAPPPGERPLLALSPAVPGRAMEHDDPDRGASVDRPPASRPPEPDGAAPKAGDATSSHRPGAGASGAGTGSSQTSPPRQGPRPAPDAGRGAEQRRPSETQPAAGPLRAAGGGGEDEHAAGSRTSDGPAGARASATARPSREAPPWQTDAWPADVRRAREALGNDRVPPAYQEMVRRYFERP